MKVVRVEREINGWMDGGGNEILVLEDNGGMKEGKGLKIDEEKVEKNE